MILLVLFQEIIWTRGPNNFEKNRYEDLMISQKGLLFRSRRTQVLLENGSTFLKDPFLWVSLLLLECMRFRMHPQRVLVLSMLSAVM